MSAADIAIVIGAVAALITTVGGFVIQIITLRNVKNGNVQTSEIKHLVNSAADEAKTYNVLLADTIRDAGRKVPADPSVKTPSEVAPK